MLSRTPSPSLHSSIQRGLLELVLDRPDQRNAIDPDLRDRLAEALEEAATDSAVQAVIISGANGAFCAGGDLGRFDQLHDARVYRHTSHRLTSVIDSIERLEKPVVAAIDGVVTGAGLALALACDWRIGSPRARILFREGRLSLVPTHGGVTRLVKLLGLARAKEVLLGGEEIAAERALELGLLSELTSADQDLLERAGDRARAMLDRAPLSFAAAKRLLTLAADVDSHSGVLAESIAQTALLATEDHREGLAAARERRPPVFRGA